MDLGYAALIKMLGLPALPLPHASRRAATRRTVESPDGVLDEYPAGYTLPAETAVGQLEFAFKYDGINLPVLWHVMRKIPAADLVAHLREKPGSKYAHMMGYFFEMLTGEQLELDFPLTGAYMPVLDPEMYVTGPAIAVTKWRVKDNLLGNPWFCPMISRTKRVNEALEWSPLPQLEKLRASYPPEMFVRAATWFYLAETRSTNAIENETPAPERAQRFVQLLRAAGGLPLDVAMMEATLETLQEAVVDPKKRTLIGWRGIQSWVGPPLLYGNMPIVDYPCPPADDVAQLMVGLKDSVLRCDTHPLVRASVASFGTVFVHPFEDGNGRVSRYLIHDMFTRDGLTPRDFIFPVSAVILQHQDKYRAALEAHSKPISRLARLRFDVDAQVLEILNKDDVEPLYRYPDLTRQTEYLYLVTLQCAETEIVHEVDTLARMERARLQVREQLDLPDRRLNELIGLMHQNGGRLSKSKRASRFQDLEDAEVEHAEECYREAFRRDEPAPPAS